MDVALQWAGTLAEELTLVRTKARELARGATVGMIRTERTFEMLGCQPIGSDGFYIVAFGLSGSPQRKVSGPHARGMSSRLGSFLRLMQGLSCIRFSVVRPT